MNKMMNKRGITPIIAIVLLLMITVAVAGSVNFWLGSVQKSTQTGVEESTGAIASQTQNRIDVRFKQCETTESGGENKITVQVLNVGTKSIRGGIVSVTVKDDNGNDLAYIENNTVNSFSDTEYLDADETIRIEWPIDEVEHFDIQSDTTYQLAITLPGSISTTTTCTTPKV